MTDIIAIAIIVLIVGAALFYVIKKKKEGAVCIGCPHAGKCNSSKNGGECSCNKD